MEQGNKKIVIIAVIFAVITSFLLFSYIKKIEAVNKNIEFINIPVAAKKIEPKTTITAQDLKEVKVEKNSVNVNALLTQSEILGQITVDPIYEGEQILKNRLANKENSSLVFSIPEGKRAITINVNESACVGYFVTPGDKVDVIATLQKETVGNIELPEIAKTLLQDILVLGVGQVKDAAELTQNKTDQKDAKGATPANAQAQIIKTVTIAVTPVDAEKIALAQQKGILTLTLRPAESAEDTINSAGVIRSDLLR